jgi:redox-sensitive bicupin YhaK (pirin superfamily)
VGGHTGPGATHTPIAVAHATLSPGAELVVPWPVEFNALAYALGGRGTVGPEHRPFGTGELAVFGAGDTITVAAAGVESQERRSPTLDVLVLGGQPIREPIVWHGPFVMNTEAEIAAALEDFEAGRMGTVPPGALGTP